MQQRGILIGGSWTQGSETFEVRAPFNGEKLADVASVGVNEMQSAIGSASSAAKEMRSLSRFQIAEGLRALADGIKSRKEEFANVIAREAGKPLIYARGEVERGISTFSWAAGEAERFTGEVVPVDTQPNGRNKSAYTRRIPRGVVYGITPFNFPLNLVAHKVAPALAAANAIIIKPSPRTPLTALLLGEVFLDSGLPAGALQIVPMDVKHMEAVLDDERIAMISFTGSAEVGWKLKENSGTKMVTLELGGNAPVIVDESADIERSLSRTTAAAFAYSGQVCISAQRIFVHKAIAEKWTDEFVARSSALKRGAPLDETTQLSAMIDEQSAKRAESWVREAVDNGAKLLCGGNRDGAFFDATVLTHTDPEMRVVAEEVFGPVAVVERFSTFGEAVSLANNSKYGLQAGVFTADMKSAQYAAENLEFGGVIINDAPNFRVDNMPYGGMKQSGFGREGVRYAMEEMSEIRVIVTEQ